MTSHPTRVFLWSCPRSLSTAFTRSMENIPDVHIVFEPYCIARQFGPGGRFSGDDDAAIEPDYTFDRVKEMLEDPKLNHKRVFVKDFAYAVDQNYSKIAKGFKHSFLIRHPAKSYLSLYKLANKSENSDVDKFIETWYPEGLGYKEMFHLFNYVSTTEGVPPVVVDSDDFLANPKLILSEYCGALGLEYSDRLLTWESFDGTKWDLPKCASDCNSNYDWLTTSMKAGGFDKSTSNRILKIPELPEMLVDLVEEAMPYYKHLLSHCICPENLDKKF